MNPVIKAILGTKDPTQQKINGVLESWKRTKPIEKEMLLINEEELRLCDEITNLKEVMLQQKSLWEILKIKWKIKTIECQISDLCDKELKLLYKYERLV